MGFNSGFKGLTGLHLALYGYILLLLSLISSLILSLPSQQSLPEAETWGYDCLL